MTERSSPVISKKERLETLQTVADQSKEWWAYQNTMPEITCVCGIKWAIHYMYKCYYCAIFFCKGCAFHHFEDDEHE